MPHAVVSREKGVGRDWAYLPDAGEIFAQLMGSPFRPAKLLHHPQ